MSEIIPRPQAGSLAVSQTITGAKHKKLRHTHAYRTGSDTTTAEGAITAGIKSQHNSL
jgi:hypothetical protein